MKNYSKNSIKLLFSLVCFLSFLNVSISQNISFEKTDSFYRSEILKSDNIIWGYLTVPENWAKPEGKKIQIAVSVLKSKNNAPKTEAVVFIQGGPGASGIGNIWSWKNHPLRNQYDIVLFDVRGVGLSKPQLCPDLGQELLKILAKNQSVTEDEKQKTEAALRCKEVLIEKGIAINEYNSEAIAKDLNALRKQLNYDRWNVYAVSYGTYIAQVYASLFPKDITSLVLDSSIDDITTYYTKNTENYMNSLQKVFNICVNDEECNAEYPKLEETYYKVISDLKENPITVSVDKNLVASGSFTFNSEDFKIVIQQALYNKQLVEVIPLLINQFHAKNKDALGSLVAAFSSLLQMDYGAYYCISCNEVLPNNVLEEFKQNASKFKKIQGGLSFYKSDFDVCNSWNINRPDSLLKQHNLTNLKTATFPVLIFSGEFDPITPLGNGENLARNFKNAYTINGTTYGHVPSFTRIGNSIATKFIKNPTEKVDINAFEKAEKVQLVNGVRNNAGISEMGTSVNETNPLFLAPLIIALGLMIFFIISYIIKLFKRKYTTLSDKIAWTFSVLSAIVGIAVLVCLLMALTQVAERNYYILAFGLPDQFNYIFILLSLFLILLSLSLLFFFIRIKKLNDRSILFTLIFSNSLVAVYFFYWGIVGF
jgi:pimeloyl-ACP methyl ester carboxylesterase